MSNADTGGKRRGSVESSSRETGLLGRVMDYLNITSLTTNALRDNQMVRMMWVKNGESSSAILPGQLLAWKTGLDGTDVVYPAASAGVLICGVADWLMPAAGCAAGSYFLMTVMGPTKFLLDDNATSVEFACLINSPTVAGCVRTGTTSGSIVGRNTNRATAAAGGGAIGTATSFWGFFRPN